MSSESERMHVLQMIEDRKISAAGGLQLLDALGSGEAAAQPAAAASEPAQAPPDPGLDRWRPWWIVPMWAGIAVLLVGALLMFGAYQAGGFGFWFACATLPFIAGVLIMALAASSRSARWLHVRVHGNPASHEWPHNIAISLPLPIRFTAWVLRTLGAFIPQLKDRGVDELILALAETTSADTPLYVDVNDGDSGDHVQVYIG